MPAPGFWDDKNHAKLIGLLVRHAKLSKRDFEILAEEMGGDCTWRTIKRHLYYLRQKSEITSRVEPMGRSAFSSRAGRADCSPLKKKGMQTTIADDTDDEIEMAEDLFRDVKKEVVDVDAPKEKDRTIIKAETIDLC
ncbi:hypothetical protein AAP_00647 [Ascosphaera apis ARSEF 7405]|uniref:Uncharacterized protein n=1 Tax=Ascosphaera apis ARSEF 7405 TaxID=392613 RepID=A0A168CTT1_9EURO|nr:hypothetical protein AAP_00647 [Ascosphaera apis ARSEF 7405]